MKWAFYMWALTVLLFCAEILFFESGSPIAIVTLSLVATSLFLALPLLAILSLLGIDSLIPGFFLTVFASYLGWMTLGIASSYLLLGLQKIKDRTRRSDQPMLAARFSRKVQDDLTS